MTYTIEEIGEILSEIYSKCPSVLPTAEALPLCPYPGRLVARHAFRGQIIGSANAYAANEGSISKVILHPYKAVHINGFLWIASGSTRNEKLLRLAQYVALIGSGLVADTFLPPALGAFYTQGQLWYADTYFKNYNKNLTIPKFFNQNRLYRRFLENKNNSSTIVEAIERNNNNNTNGVFIKVENLNINIIDIYIVSTFIIISYTLVTIAVKKIKVYIKNIVDSKSSYVNSTSDSEPSLSFKRRIISKLDYILYSILNDDMRL
jgi:hypothetical protein